MRRLRFLVDPGALDGGAGTVVRLPEEEGRHFRVTLRGRPGMDVHVFDGRGRGFEGRIESALPEGVMVTLLAEERESVEPPLEVELLQAYSRDDAFEAVIDHATALGVSSIVPLLVARTQSGGRPPDARRLARFERIAREAAKLSWRRVVPRIHAPIAVGEIGLAGSLDLWLDPGAAGGSFVRAIEGAARPFVRIAVGPEGGCSDEEGARLRACGFLAVALGPRILRTEHAGPAALAVVMSRWGDLGPIAGDPRPGDP